MTTRIPEATFVSSEATFESYEDRRLGMDGILLLMRPHGVPALAGDEREVGWALTWTEVRGLRNLLSETIGGDAS